MVRTYAKSIIISLVLFFAILVDVVLGAELLDPSSLATTTLSESNQRLIVKFSRLSPGYFRNRLHEKVGTDSVTSLRQTRTYVIELSPQAGQRALEMYQSSPWVEYAEVDAQAEKLGSVEDTYYQQQWGLHDIEIEKAWEYSKGNGIKVAVLDSGIASNHPDITPQVTQWEEFAWGSYLYDRDGHGTHVAGIIAAIPNQEGIVGVAPEVELMSGKVLDDYGRGYYSWIINGIYWAVDNGADVINLSLGGTSRSTALLEAVEYASNKGVSVVAASGNSGGETVYYPAGFDQSIAVGSYLENGVLADFTSYGEWVDLVAPGENILSTLPVQNYDSHSGTSMSSPFVAGVVALLKSSKSDIEVSEVVDVLRESALVENQERGIVYKLKAGSAVESILIQFGTPTPSPIPSPTLIPTPTPSPSPSPTPQPSPTLFPSPSPSPSPSPTPIPSPSPSPSPVVSPSPTPTPEPEEEPNVPWWCKYVPWARSCKV